MSERDDEVLYRLGELAGKLEAHSLVCQQTYDRVLYLERQLLPLLGRRAAWVGAGGGISAAAALLTILRYVGAF